MAKSARGHAHEGHSYGVDEGWHELFSKAIECIQSDKVEKDIAKKDAIKEIELDSDNEEVSFGDINEEVDEDGGTSFAIVEVIFELMEESVKIVSKTLQKRKLMVKTTSLLSWNTLRRTNNDAILVIPTSGWRRSNPTNILPTD